MDARYTMRKAQLLEACQVAPEVFEQVLPRLRTFMAPFVDTVQGQAPRAHAQTYVRGLLSDVERKTVASIASHCGQDRLGLQGFIGWDDGEDGPLRHTLRSQVGQHWGQADGVLVFDPAAFPTSGRESVGVARQWCGRLGTVDPCHVAISLGSGSRQGHTRVDLRFYVPTAWTQEKARLAQAGGPPVHRGYRTRHQCALERLATNGAALPHRWMAGDDARGRPSWFRRRLATLGARALVAVPANTFLRALETEGPEASGLGRRPNRPWHRVAQWRQARGDDAWKRIDVRDGAKGPLGVAVVKRRVASRPHRRPQGDEETLVGLRSRDRAQEQGVKVDDSLSNAAPETSLEACARVATANHRLEACLQRSKSAAGWSDYAVRHGTGWHHQQTLSLLATWFLERETHRGKTMDPGNDGTAESPRHRGDLTRGVSVRDAVA
jgi:SRSO17 transposase